MVEEVVTSKGVKTYSNSDNSVKKNNIWKITIIAVSILLIIVITFLKIQNPQFEWKWFSLIVGIIAVISIVLYFVFSLQNAMKKLKNSQNTSKLPEPASAEALEKLVTSIVESEQYENHIKQWCDANRYVGLIGDFVYCFEVIPLYQEFKDEVWYIIINAHSTESKQTVLTNLDRKDDNSYVIQKSVRKNFLHQDPEKQKSRMKIFNPLSNTYSEIESTDEDKINSATKNKTEDLA